MSQINLSSEVFIKPVTAFPELHSEEVHEILNRPPSWLVRWGMALFFALLMVLVAGCWLIKYPDIVSTPFSLTAIDAPRKVVVRSEGKLFKLLVKDGQSVTKGQHLSYGESTADPVQVLHLGGDIEKFGHTILNGRWTSVNTLHIDEYTRLGEIQNDFQTFSQKLTELKTFLSGGFYLQKRKLLLDDVNDLKDLKKIWLNSWTYKNGILSLGRMSSAFRKNYMTTK